jgi:hypothetical protein
MQSSEHEYKAGDVERGENVVKAIRERTVQDYWRAGTRLKATTVPHPYIPSFIPLISSAVN